MGEEFKCFNGEWGGEGSLNASMGNGEGCRGEGRGGEGRGVERRGAYGMGEREGEGGVGCRGEGGEEFKCFNGE